MKTFSAALAALLTALLRPTAPFNALEACVRGASLTYWLLGEGAAEELQRVTA